MDDFILDQRLKHDTFFLGQLEFCQVLLMNNSRVPWIILVPCTDIKEVCDLTELEQKILNREIDIISLFVKQLPGVDKLNVAWIGNVVSQLHIHIVGRNPDDYCWPNVVWGAKGAVFYSEEELAKIRNLFENWIEKEKGQSNYE